MACLLRKLIKLFLSQPFEQIQCENSKKKDRIHIMLHFVDFIIIFDKFNTIKMKCNVNKRKFISFINSSSFLLINCLIINFVNKKNDEVVIML